MGSGGAIAAVAVEAEDAEVWWGWLVPPLRRGVMWSISSLTLGSREDLPQEAQRWLAALRSCQRREGESWGRGAGVPRRRVARVMRPRLYWENLRQALRR